jgi:protein gp37
MSESTAISWCDSTWSPWEGCAKVSPACDHCYAERMNKWLRKGENWGPGAPRREFGEDHWDKPLRWNAAAAKAGKPRTVFPSVCDPFDNEVDFALRERFFALIRSTPKLRWLLLTKRIGNVPAMVAMIPGWLPPNVWLGATICNQAEADRDIEKLLEVPARVRFISYEPALGALDLTRIPLRRNGRDAIIGSLPKNAHIDALRGFSDNGTQTRIDWVIAGGESGPGARPMHPDWVRSLRDQCAAAGVPFHFKQWGEWAPNCLCDTAHAHRDTPRPVSGKPGCMFRCGTKAAGRQLDGIEHNGAPK